MDPLATHDIEQITADNPGPFTLRGTNTWLVGRDPCYLIAPGPPLAAHRERILADARDRGGIGGIAITHDHGDHVDGLVELLVAAGGPPGAAGGPPARRPPPPGRPLRPPPPRAPPRPPPGPPPCLP